MYYLPDIMTHSLEESRRDLENSVRAVTAQPRREYFLRMEEKGTGELIGEIGYTVTEETPVGKLVHAGYFSRKRFWVTAGSQPEYPILLKCETQHLRKRL